MSTFILPYCKERWLTAAAIDATGTCIVVGDRCGNIHAYVLGNNAPIKSFSKVHGRYGPTTITISNNTIISTGRNGTIKEFVILKEDGVIKAVKYLSAKDVEFQWVEKFLDRDNNIVCGFQERLFVVHNVRDNNKLIEIQCGGGHRSWDVIKYYDKRKDHYEEFIHFVYVKNSDINSEIFQTSKIISRNIIYGTHFKEINCLEIITSNDIKYLISGGEDTTLRIAEVKEDLQSNDVIIFKHLSSIRVLNTCSLKDSVLIFSAGGRAQLCINKIKFDIANVENKVNIEHLIDYLIKGKDKERKNNQDWRNHSIDFDPETRIMDMEVSKTNDHEITIYAACSDASLRIFKYNIKQNEIVSFADIKYHKTCILKTHQITLNGKDILITCTTRGVLAFWDISDSASLNDNTEPLFVTNANKSGINSITSRVLANDVLLLASGGDDNAIHIKLFKVQRDEKNKIDFHIIDSWCSAKLHCSQITGLVYVDDTLISTSIDQRLTCLKLNVVEDRIDCNFLSQTFSDVSDIQGLKLVDVCSNGIKVCVYGKGTEVLEILETTSIDSV